MPKLYIFEAHLLILLSATNSEAGSASKLRKVCYKFAKVAKKTYGGTRDLLGVQCCLNEAFISGN